MRNRLKWGGPELEALRLDYADMSVTVRVVAAKYGTSTGLINKLARIHGWPLRRPPGRMSPDIERMKNIRTALAWRINKMNDRLARVDARIREMGDGVG